MRFKALNGRSNSGPKHDYGSCARNGGLTGGMPQSGVIYRRAERVERDCCLEEKFCSFPTVLLRRRSLLLLLLQYRFQWSFKEMGEKRARRQDP